MAGNIPDRYTLAAQEDRSAPRPRRIIPAALRPSGEKRFHTALQDLSISGFSAASAEKLTPGTPCSLTVPGLNALKATVVWWNAGVVGCAFEDLMNPVICNDLLYHWRGAGGDDDDILNA